MFEQILKDDYILNLYEQVKDYEQNDSDAWAFHDLTHALSVINISVSILEQLNCTKDEAEAIKIAALLHDIGAYEGKDDHEIKGYNLAKEYLEDKDIKLKSRILEAIKDHRKGYDSSDIITRVLVLADKLDIKKTRVAPAGESVIGNRQLLFIENINIVIKDKFIVNFIINDNCNIEELENFYFMNKVVNSITYFANKLNLECLILKNDKVWQIKNNN